MANLDAPDGGQKPGVRQRQKLATQRKLLRAARALGNAGQLPSIADVAKHAKVSVATAYRYYSDPYRLQADAALDQSLDGGQQDFVGMFESAAEKTTDPLERLLVAQRQMMGNTIEHEAAYRLFVAKGHEEIVRNGLKRGKHAAGGRRVLMIEAALKGIRPRMTEPAWRHMVFGLMIVMGPEPFFILKDFGGLSDEQIWETVEQTIAAVFAAHRQDGPTNKV